MKENQLLHLFNSLLDELNSGHGYTGLVKQFSRFFSCDTLLTDDIFQTLAFVTTEDKIFTSNLIEVHSDSTFHIKITATDELWEAVDVPLYEQGNLIGYLFLRKSLLEQSAQRYHVEMAASVLAKFMNIEQKKQQELRKAGQKYKDSFIFDLLYGNIKSTKDIISKGALWNADFSHAHTVLVFELQDYEHYSMDYELLDRVYRVFEKNLIQLNIIPFILKKQEELIILLPLPEKENYVKCRKFILHLIDMLKRDAAQHLNERRLSAGVGRTYERPIDLFRSYQEAKVAKILRDQNSEEDVTFFTDIGLLKLLYNHDYQELKEFEKDILGELVKFDQNSEMSLIETLECYINHNCDIKQTAEEMYLHRNTLRYRINKIEELLQVDINDIQTVINFAVAFKIRQLDQLTNV